MVPLGPDTALLDWEHLEGLTTAVRGWHIFLFEIQSPVLVHI